MAKKRGITIVENLVTLVLLAVIVMATIGSFVIAKMGAVRANHKAVAMDLIREYLGKEMITLRGPWNGGEYAMEETTIRNIDGIKYTIVPDPCIWGDPIYGIKYTEGTGNDAKDYKIIGFRVQWDEPLRGKAGTGQSGYGKYSEKAVVSIAKH